MASLKTPPRRAAPRKPINAQEPVVVQAPEPVVVAEAAPIAPEQQPEAEPRAARAPRVPLGTQRQKLTRPDRPGFVRRWFNDEGGRIMLAKGAGFTHVNDPHTGEPEIYLVGVSKQGGGLKAYLMEIPEEYYKEDMVAKDAPLKQFDADVRRGHGSGTAPGDDGRYVPKNPDGSPRIVIKSTNRMSG